MEDVFLIAQPPWVFNIGPLPLWVDMPVAPQIAASVQDSGRAPSLDSADGWQCDDIRGVDIETVSVCIEKVGHIKCTS